MPGEKLGDLLVDRRPVTAEQKAPMAIVDRLDQRGHLALGAGAVAHLDLELPLAKAGRDLELVERDPALLDLPQALRDLGLRDAEQAEHDACVRLSAIHDLLYEVRLQGLGPHCV